MKTFLAALLLVASAFAQNVNAPTSNPYTNDPVTAVVVNGLSVFTGTTMRAATNSDTGLVPVIVTSTETNGSGSIAWVASNGLAKCTFDSNYTSGGALSYVVLSTTAAPECRAQSTVPAPGTCSVGYLASASTSTGATANVQVNPSCGGSGGIGYPASGVAVSNGSAWLTPYQVGTGANNLVQLNGSSQLPAVSAANLTNFPSFSTMFGVPNIAVGSLATTSLAINGATAVTSTSSSNTQAVTCPTGGSGTQVCDAAGVWVANGSGSGTVNTGTATQVAYYATSTNAVSPDAALTDSAGTLTYSGAGGLNVNLATFSGSGALMVSYSQGTLATPIANARNISAPASVTGTITELLSGTAAGGFRYATLSGSTETDSTSELSGDATTSGSTAVTVAKINGTAFSGTNGDLVCFGASNIPADCGFLGTKVVRKDSGNTGAANMTLNMSASNTADPLVVPVKAGSTAGAAGSINFDSTATQYHGFFNGADGLFANSDLFAVNSQTANYQVLASDFASCKLIQVPSGGTVNITLVASGSQPPNGQCIWIQNGQTGGTNTVTIVRSGQNINGSAANFIMKAGTSGISSPSMCQVVSDSVNYWVSCMGLNAISLGGANFAAPGAIGGTTPGAMTGTTLAFGTSLGVGTGAGTLLTSATAPSIAGGGCGGSAASIPVNNGTASFTINTGTGPTSGGCTITLPAATTDWVCSCTDRTTNSTAVFACKQSNTAASTTSAVLTMYSDVAAAAAPVANDILRVSCFAN